eukprot:TRINITY_DN40053_c0_g1_i3.p1 TRINITY_DN40053_c0_g1~~TRINITY_DN40053_c0_g1_i3.p1  ORF type:complete len:620 (+),score=49.86 TRINITY_DN40053_c0_g1_i3:48-1907(+)
MEGLSGESRETYAVWLLFGIRFTCILVYVGGLCHRACASLSFKEACGSGLSWLKAWFQNVKRHLAARHCQDSFERKVRRLVEDERRERCISLCCIGVHIAALLAVLTLMQRGLCNFGVYRDLAEAKRLLHQSGFMTLTLAYCMALYGWLLPAWTTVRTFDMFHFLVLARLCAQVFASESVYQLFALETVAVSSRLLGASIVGTPKSTLALNSLYALTKLWAYSALFSDMSSEEQEFVMRAWGKLPLRVMEELLVCAMTWCVCTIVQTWNYSAVRANLHAAASSTGEEAVKAILVVMCDVVIHIDQDLRFTSPAIEIAQFLLRRPLNMSYQGAPFLEFMEEQDRDRVRYQLTHALIGHGTAQSISTKLIDGNGSAISVQIYCTCFIDVDDSRAYVIGILEVKEHTPTVGRTDHMSVEGPTDWFDGVRGAGSLHAAASEHERDSFESAETRDSAMIPLVTDNSKMQVWIDISDKALLVVDASTPMRSISGPICYGRTSFVDWLRPCDSSAVTRCIANALKTFAHHNTLSKAKAVLGKVHLRTPHGELAGLEYFADMRIDMSSLLTSHEEDSHVAVCLEFHDVHVKGRTSSRPNRRQRRRRGAESDEAPVPVMQASRKDVSL